MADNKLNRKVNSENSGMSVETPEIKSVIYETEDSMDGNYNQSERNSNTLIEATDDFVYIFNKNINICNKIPIQRVYNIKYSYNNDLDGDMFESSD